MTAGQFSAHLSCSTSHHEQLGGGVGWRPAEGGQVLLLRVDAGREPEVAEEDVVPAGEEDVLGLDVPVDHPPAVEVTHGGQDLEEYSPSSVLREPPCQVSGVRWRNRGESLT